LLEPVPYLAFAYPSPTIPLRYSNLRSVVQGAEITGSCDVDLLSLDVEHDVLYRTLS
jgi:hypothetical protein